MEIVFVFFLIVFGAVVTLLLIIKEAIDMAAAIEYAEGAFPWLKRWSESKKWQRLLLVGTLLFYGGTLYKLLNQPPLPPIVNPDPAVKAIVPVVKENADLEKRLARLNEPEPQNSVRRQTVNLANELADFWARNPAPPQSMQAAIKGQASDQYWNGVTTTFNYKFRDRLVGIIRSYSSKGVPVGYLERSAEEPTHLFGAFPFSSSGQSPPACAQDEICQLRELAFHVDANDQVIQPDFKQP